VSHLTEACLHFNVKVVEGNAFLGRGAFGRVFKVIRPNKEVLALKIVESCHVRRLHQEHNAMTNAQRTDLTATVTENVMDTPECAAFLLKPVGKPLSYPKTQEEVHTLFELLWQLHNKGVIHGDPRVPNVIVHEKKLLWIDLVDVFKSTTSSLRQLDAKILALSVLRVSLNFELDSTVLNLISNYGKVASRENICHLADSVYRILEVT
jgi:tRNA A-37 threonylcarbamoyl transferase component Bud32